MTSGTPFFRLASAAALAMLIAAPEALAQSASACPAGKTVAVSLQVLQCPQGLTITLEAGASLTLSDSDGNGGPESSQLDGKAILIESPDGGAAAAFEVVTPQAIAAVRGTRWAVDAQDGKTSVFVIRGRVDVRRAAGGREGVILGPGEGVDVGGAAGPLEVRRWPPARVDALLARLGQ
jgi:ferric-dicitrate binding protein FerR (iron transport regulator)